MTSSAFNMANLFNSSSGLPPVDYNRLKSFNSRIDSAIEDFVAEKSTSSESYQSIKNIQQEVDIYFVSYEKPDTMEYLQLMTDICTKLNENPIVDSVNEQFMHKPSQKYSSLTNYVQQHNSDLDELEALHAEYSFSYRAHQQRYQDIDEMVLPGRRATASRRPHKQDEDSKSGGIPPEMIGAAIASSGLTGGSQKGEEAHPTSATATGNNSQSMNNILRTTLEKSQEIVNEITALLDDRKLLQANSKVLQVEQILAECEASRLNESERTVINEFREKNAEMFEIVKDDTDIINYNLECLKNQEGWITDKQKGKIRISYQFPDANSMSLKMESELDVPLKNLLCIANEFKYFKEYVPFVKEGYLVKDIRKATKVGYALMDVPMVSKRECYFYGAGFNLLDDFGMIPLISKSIHSNQEFCKKIGIDVPQQTKHVRLDYKYYMFNIQPLGPNKCFITIILNVDYKIPLVPKSIQNWCARKFSLFLFEKIIKKATNFAGSDWEKAMNQDKDFYDWLDTQINHYLQGTGLTDDSYTLEEAKVKIAKYLAEKNSNQNKTTTI